MNMFSINGTFDISHNTSFLKETFFEFLLTASVLGRKDTSIPCVLTSNTLPEHYQLEMTTLKETVNRLEPITECPATIIDWPDYHQIRYTINKLWKAVWGNFSVIERSGTCLICVGMCEIVM